MDCVLSDWKAWSPCSVSCGHGVMTRQRIIEQEARSGGKECDGDMEETQQCGAGCCVPLCHAQAVFRQGSKQN